MSSIKKHVSVGWVMGILLGITCSAFAGSVGGTFNTGDTLTAAQMTGIQSAVNDNNTRITTLEANACPVNMTRVGATCIDQAQVSNSVTWAGAIDTCRLAGKRLLTPSELYAAYASGAISITDGNSEWVDAVVAAGTDNTGAGGNASFGVGRMGPNISGGSGFSGAGVLGFVAVDQATDTVGSDVGFRCAK